MKGVIAGDFHLRKDTPISRPETDEEWQDFQFLQVGTVIDFCKEKDLDLLTTGDLFDKSQPYYGIVGRLRHTVGDFWERFFRLAGNHDLPYHSFENAFNSGWYSAPGIDITEKFRGAFHFGTEPKNPDAKIVFTHQLVFPDEKSRPFADVGKTATELLAEFPKAKWIFTGDYHKHFHYEENGRHVVNPGCLIRQKAGEEDYTCGFYEVDTRAGLVKFHELTDEADFILDHLELVKAREGRLDAFIEKINKKKGLKTVPFKECVAAKLRLKGVSKGVRDIINEIETEVEIGVKK